jgi:hypothetical protein
MIVLTREDAQRLQAAAAADAARSSRRRDLALVLDWALASPRVVVLRRSEARELGRLAESDPSLSFLTDALASGARRADAA